MRIALVARVSWFGLALATFGLAAHGATLEGRLEDGTRIEINTQTNRAEVIGEGGRRTPLWDGIHTLRDGSTVRIQSGVVIPELPIVEAPQRPNQEYPAPELAEREMAGLVSQCERLVEKVCGLRRQCSGTQGCDAAQQLLAMEREERGKATSPVAMTPSGSSCREALHDEGFFARCTR
jgi:hypothetical protein